MQKQSHDITESSDGGEDFQKQLDDLHISDSSGIDDSNIQQRFEQPQGATDTRMAVPKKSVKEKAAKIIAEPTAAVSQNYNSPACMLQVRDDNKLSVSE